MPQDYNEKKEREALRQRKKTAAGRDFGPTQDVLDPERREACREDFARFCTTYNPELFYLDWSTNHVEAIAKIEEVILGSSLYAFAMPRGSGKAQPLDTPIPTPTGWTTIGDISVGDKVLGQDGKPTTVTYLSPINLKPESYELTFSNGEKIKACADHLWLTTAKVDKPGEPGQNRRGVSKATRVRTTKELFDTQKYGKRGDNNHSIRLSKPLELPEADLLIDPYVFGYWLGDGTSKSNQIAVGNEDIPNLVKQLEAAGYTDWKEFPTNSEGCKLIRFGYKENGAIRSKLRELGVFGNKHIPMQYLRASKEQRIALLQGLMDSDGTIGENGRCEFCVTSKVLAEGVSELLSTLGIKNVLRESELKAARSGYRYRISFSSGHDFNFFRLPRKAERSLPPFEAGRVTRGRVKSDPKTNVIITSIEKCDPVPMRCIQVDNEDHLFLCGRSMIPTHNTTLSRMAVLWAISYGHCKYVYLIGANAGKAQDGLDAVKTWARFLPKYGLDFPEIAQGIQALGGVANRASGQLSEGEPTLIEWTKDKVVLPTVNKPRNIWTEEEIERNAKGERITADTSGIVVGVSGLTGDGIRGSLHVIHTGAAVRPDLVIVDDPQSDESAKSPKQVQDRIELLSGAVLNMAGPDKRIRGIMPCTIIQQNDMAAQILDRKQHPLWRGTVTRLLESFPSNMGMWEKYFDVLESALDENDISGEQTNAFYEENREELEKGCIHNWLQRKDPQHVSAIQTAMELWYRDKRTFMAEFQNDPESSEGLNDYLTPSQIAHKQWEYDRNTCPDTMDKLVCHIDVQKYALFYTICAFDSESFDGVVVDYGVFPEQDRRYFSYPDVKPSLADMGCESAEEQVYHGLTQLGMYLKGYVVNKYDGTEQPIDKVLVDSGYLTSTVNKFCDQDLRLFMPMQGVGVRATQQPLGTRSGSKATKVGWNYEIRKSPQYGRLRYVLADVNAYKSFVHERFKTPIGGDGALGLFKDRPRNHQMWADHMRAELSTVVEAKGRRITEWTAEPHCANHFFDTLVGCHVAAAIEGCVHPASGIDGRKRRRVLKTGKIEIKNQRK